MSRWRESYPSFFMATVTVPAEWITDQVLPPEAPVDLYVFNADLTEGIPESTVPADAGKTVKSAPKSKS
jgi:hypothetical protein